MAVHCFEGHRRSMLFTLEVGSVHSYRGWNQRPQAMLFASRTHRQHLTNVVDWSLLPTRQRKRRIGFLRRSPTRPKHVPLRTYAEYARCPFNQDDYKRCMPNSDEPTTEDVCVKGTLLLVEDVYDVSDQEIDPRGMLVHVGGDTFSAIAFEAEGRQPERPMTPQLLYNILEYVREQQPTEWHLLHVAIVDLRNQTFIGRLFFGNPETGEIRWDCDCRASDASWMSLKTMCPMYVRNSVWESCAHSLESIFSNQVEARSSLENLGFLEEPEANVANESADPFTTIRPNDPVVIKRLKREMSLAVVEEDYSTAARIRDHPYMQKYKSIFHLRKEGKHDQAESLEQELRQEIEKDNMAHEDDV